MPKNHENICRTYFTLHILSVNMEIFFPVQIFVKSFVEYKNIFKGSNCFVKVPTHMFKFNDQFEIQYHFNYPNFHD